MKKLLITALFAAALLGCKKETLEPNCRTEHTLQFRVTNNFKNPYDIYYNDKFLGSVPAFSNTLFTIPSGFGKLVAKEFNGSNVMANSGIWNDCDLKNWGLY